MIINKRIAITGHCSGIGKAVYDLLVANNEVLGFSRTNDFDLSNKEKYKQFIETMKTCDIVFNNAYSPEYRFLQTDIINEFVDHALHDESKLIVTMGSMSKYVSKPIPAYTRYASSKILIDDTVNRLKDSGHKCGLIVVSPGWVKTPMYDSFKDKNPNQVSPNPLSAEEMAEQIVMLMEMFYEKNINVYSYEVRRMRL